MKQAENALKWQTARREYAVGFAAPIIETVVQLEQLSGATLTHELKFDADSEPDNGTIFRVERMCIEFPKLPISDKRNSYIAVDSMGIVSAHIVGGGRIFELKPQCGSAEALHRILRTVRPKQDVVTNVLAQLALVAQDAGLLTLPKQPGILGSASVPSVLPKVI